MRGLFIMLAGVFVPFGYRSGIGALPRPLEQRLNARIRWIPSVVSLVASVRGTGGSFGLGRPLSDPGFPCLGVLIASPIFGILHGCSDQHIVQQVLTAKDLATARRGLVFGGLPEVWKPRFHLGDLSMTEPFKPMAAEGPRWQEDRFARMGCSASASPGSAGPSAWCRPRPPRTAGSGEIPPSLILLAAEDLSTSKPVAGTSPPRRSQATGLPSGTIYPHILTGSRRSGPEVASSTLRIHPIR